MMKILAIIILLIFLWVFSQIMKQAHAPMEVLFALAVSVVLLFAVYRMMPWVFTNLSTGFSTEEQDCYGIPLEEGKCFGIVRDAY